MLTESQLTLVISLIAVFISVVALIYTMLTFMLKSGSKIRGSFSPCSSIACEDWYICNITLENLKDRPIIIYVIYLQLGHNYFLEIENFEDEPLILKPFEAYKKKYDPIDFYSVNMKRISLNDLFNKKIKKRLVLSTSTGRYIIKSNIKHWDPIRLYFANYMTALIHPIRLMHKGKSYGINVKYIVDFTPDDGETYSIPIYPMDYRILKFKHFILTEESLKSKVALEKYLERKAKEGTLNCSNFIIHDMEKWRNENYRENYQLKETEVIKAKYYNWWKYNILGWLGTEYRKYKLRAENNKRVKKSKNHKGTETNI